MEKLINLALLANKHMKNADHMVYMTYPLVKDVRLLISITDNIDKAIKLSIMAFLRYEWIYKRIIKIPEDFDKRVELFKKIGINRYGFRINDLEFVNEIDEIMVKHRQSPIEFIRNGKFMISYNNYKFKTIDYPVVKDYISKAKPFILRLNNIIQNDQLIDSRRWGGGKAS